jgi:hypothetical protein
MYRLRSSQVTASSRNVADATTPKRSASTRQGGAFDGRLFRSLSATVNHGSPYLREVGHQLICHDGLLILATVQFLDESHEIRSQYTDDGSYPINDPVADYDNSPKPGSSRSQNSNTTPSFTLATPTDGFTVLSLLNSESPGHPPPHSAPPGLQDNHDHLDTFPRTESSTFVYQQPPGQPILWPLDHEQEAMLLQHYIENVALFVSVTFSFIITHAHDS